MFQIAVRSTRSLCPAEGFHELEPSACAATFVRCQKSMGGRMEGALYQCPNEFAFWQISRRCERTSKLLNCNGSELRQTKWQIPIEKSNISYRRRKSAYLDY